MSPRKLSVVLLLLIMVAAVVIPLILAGNIPVWPNRPFLPKFKTYD